MCERFSICLWVSGVCRPPVPAHPASGPCARDTTARMEMGTDCQAWLSNQYQTDEETEGVPAIEAGRQVVRQAVR